MIQDILLVVSGMVAGCAIGIFIMCMFIVGKQSDIETERLMGYKDGYQKGFEDGYELQKSHTK